MSRPPPQLTPVDMTSRTPDHPNQEYADHQRLTAADSQGAINYIGISKASA